MIDNKKWISEESNVINFWSAGQTCFHMASASDNVDCIRALFRSGFDCNAYDCEGRTPLHVASELNNVIAVECLLNEVSNQHFSLSLCWWDTWSDHVPNVCQSLFLFFCDFSHTEVEFAKNTMFTGNMG